MHGWDGQANGDRDVLWRIVALLVALAGIADLAAGLPFFRRRETLGILGSGEAAVRIYFAGMALGPLSEDDAFYDDEPEPCRDASALAARFRALGFMLAALLTLADLSAPPRPTFPLHGRRESILQASRRATRPVPAAGGGARSPPGAGAARPAGEGAAGGPRLQKFNGQGRGAAWRG